MKIRFERGGVVLEYEHQPMKEGRFRALCALAAAGVYGCVVIAVTALCGPFGLFSIVVASALLAAIGKGMD